jgi:FHS family glucose/mannose:H+ symporter-like MFS transporter
MPQHTIAQPHHLKFVRIALFAGFIITGMVATLLGPVLPVFIARWNLTDSQAGLFFTTQFSGSLLGVFLSSVILSLRGYRDSLVLGFLLMAAGVAGLNSHSQHIALFATAVYGFGFGVAVPATNLCIAEISGTQRAAALTLLNMAWGVGAIACPVVVLAGLKLNRFTTTLLGISLGALVLAMLFAAMKFESPLAATSREAVAQNSATHAHPLHVPVALALLFYLYVGTEAGISGWAAEQGHRVGAGAAYTIMPMFFWAGLLCGRGVSASIVSRVKENLLVILGLALAALGTTCLLLSQTRALLITGVLLAGFGLAGLYPIYIAWLSEWYGQRARRLGGVMFSMAALGGASMPWTVGFISQQSRSLRIGLLVPLVGCCAMLILVIALRRRITA